MSTENQSPKSENGPAWTRRYGSVFAKIWENEGSDGQIFRSIEIGKTYTDTNGKFQETNKFTDTEVLKVQQLSQEAFRTVQLMREMNVSQELGHHIGLKAQRDQAMCQAKKPDQSMGQGQRPAQVHAPEM